MVAFIVYDPPKVGPHAGEYYWCISKGGTTVQEGWFRTIDDLPYEWLKTAILYMTWKGN